MDESILQEIGRFDEGFKPEPSFRPGLETLPDGDYSFEIVAAELGRTKNSQDPILRFSLRVDGGMVIEKIYFFKTQEGVNRLGADLLTLKLPIDTKSPFSKQLGVAMKKLPGIKFRGRKSTDQSATGGKSFPNLVIISLDTGKANRPAKPGPVSSDVGSEDVPF